MKLVENTFRQYNVGDNTDGDGEIADHEVDKCTVYRGGADGEAEDLNDGGKNATQGLATDHRGYVFWGKFAYDAEDTSREDCTGN